MTELNHRLRRLLASAGFLAGLAVLLWGLHILTVPYYTVSASWSQYRSLEAGTLDVLIVGNSHAYTSTAPFQVWDEQGITTWHVGGASINARMKRAYVEQAFAFQRPKVLALEVNRMDQTRIQDDQVNYWAYTHMPWGLPRALSIFDTATPRKWDRFLFPLIGEHHRYGDLFPYSIVRNAGIKKDPTTGGATVLYTAPPPQGDKAAQGAAAPAGGNAQAETERDQLFQYNADEIRRIAELCQQNGVHLMLWLAPVQGNYTVGKDPLPLIRAQLSGDFPDIVYLNTNLHHEEIGLVDDDFRDSGHLYSWGMKKATSFIARRLAESYSGAVATDHTEETIERWDQWAAEWNPPMTLQEPR